MQQHAAPAAVTTGTVRIPVPGAARPMAGYAARPAGEGPWPAVVVGFEMFGITPYVRRVADRLAGLGLLAVVPDFYHRTAPGHSGTADAAGRARGLELIARLTREEVADDLTAVLAHLEQRADTAGRPSMAGFSLGGHLAWFAATQVPLTAVAAVYPGWLGTPGTALSRPEALLDLTPRIAAVGGCRLLYLAGDEDHVATPEQTGQVRERLAAAGVPHEVVVYPGAPHGFLADERDTYRPAAAEDAWRRLAAFLAPRS
ncbi:dienelactone hydrolase family protein [Streptomyces sp. NPDC020983]|uniref:dienelactone hydrolase family protein n=1 Tax=Streptomyces sp. NPDC020983 TaxID=3365106 RepID=UPI00378BD4AC